MKKFDYSKFEIVCFFDGAVEPYNPGGHMGTGSIVKCAKKGETLFQRSSYRAPDKKTTNNMAEYGGLWYCLDWLIRNEHTDKKIVIHGDSQLVCRQMSGEWKIKGEKGYTQAALTCHKMLDLFQHKIHFEWIPRDLNAEADVLSKKELEKRGIFATKR